MIRSFNARSRCATASSPASGVAVREALERALPDFDALDFDALDFDALDFDALVFDALDRPALAAFDAPLARLAPDRDLPAAVLPGERLVVLRPVEDRDPELEPLRLACGMLRLLIDETRRADPT